jgi:predicted transcriptional regulator
MVARKPALYNELRGVVGLFTHPRVVKTVRQAKKRKAGEEIGATQPQPKKAKRVFETTQKATVIVQGQTQRLTRPQTIVERSTLPIW